MLAMSRPGVGHVAVRVLNEDGSPCSTILDNNLKTCIVALPGKVFKVEAIILPSCPFQHSREYIRSSMTVDGNSPGSRLLFRKPGTKVWDGFGTGDAAAMTAVHAFKFADPERREGPAKFNEDAKEGKIVVRFNWVREVGRKKISRGRAGLPATGQAPKLPEGKKFFLANSLVTVPDNRRAVDRPWNSHKHDHICHIQTLEVRYETASTLELRRVLRRDNPAHRALLDAEVIARGGVPDQDDEGRAQRDNVPGPSSSKLRVKRERGGPSTPGPAVDLTGGMQRPRREPSTVEACDLTADEDAPQWSAKKRAVASGPVISCFSSMRS